MNSAELRLSYRPDEEWLGELDAVVKSGAFAGAASAWFGRQEPKDFVAALRSFPLSPSDPPMIESGFWSRERPGTLEQVHLRIAVRSYDIRGTLLVQVDLATQFSTAQEEDLHQSVAARFVTEYSALEEFASGLVQVLDGERDSAVLTGTETPL